MNNLLSTLCPVGSTYIGTQNSCPLATLIAGSQWEIVSNGRALWGGNGSNVNSTIEAGLPNITGTVFDTWHGNNPSSSGVLDVSKAGASSVSTGTGGAYK